MSYSWVLERLRDIYGRVQTPDVIVTDWDEGLSAVINVVFPGEHVFILNYCHSMYICLT